MLNKIFNHRVKALFMRHLYPLRRDFDLLSDMIYWPLIDTLTWGITGSWLTEESGSPTLVTAILMGLILWNIIWRSQSEVGRNLMDEIWNSNLSNLFSTPLKISEWLTAVLGLSVIKTIITLGIMVPAILILYAVNAFTLGWWLVPFFFLCSMTGWWVGLLGSGIVLRHGPKVQTIIWALPGILLPFSAIYFPVNRLPFLVQKISMLVPTTYVLESMRAAVGGAPINPTYLFISFGLNILYLTLAGWFFIRSFAYSKNLGLDRFL